ncbi:MULTISPECIES: DUF6230 family protein [unclassified Natrinema]|uniref:DUF6230 family protein n=1 Tax=unclassified Natrinema TaxID=2622230 RepID=UPI00026D4FC2|nr:MULTISPECIES: DUF6230 family protein [unclassified Natrinema]AFO57381.1 hypothetical protein NJ7G_2140 [Natrinema sp. J7-2]
MYRRKRLAVGTCASFLVVAIVGLVVLSSGTAYATAMATADGSGFTVTADEIRSDEFLLYPSVGENTEGTTPVAVVEQRGVEIDGMVLSGEKSIPMIDGSMEISFAADETVKADQQYIKLTNLQAEEATFNGQVVNAQASDNPEKQFQQTAGENADPEDGYLTDISGDSPGMVQKDVEMDAVYLASNEITLPGLDVDVEFHPDG